jgi:hypothetical protein
MYTVQQGQHWIRWYTVEGCRLLAELKAASGRTEELRVVGPMPGQRLVGNASALLA